MLFSKLPSPHLRGPRNFVLASASYLIYMSVCVFRSSLFQITVPPCKICSVVDLHCYLNSTLGQRGDAFCDASHVSCYRNLCFSSIGNVMSLNAIVHCNNYWVISISVISCRPPERRHGYEQQFHATPTQQEQEILEPKRPCIENVNETHFSRAQPTNIILPPPHTITDSIRTTGEVKKVTYRPSFTHYSLP